MTLLRPADSSPSWDTWFEGKKFTTDWSSRAFPIWTECLDSIKENQIEVLEIGSWEGRSSIFFLNFLPNSRVTCIDIFTLGNETRFDQNVMATHSDRVTKIKGRSATALDGLIEQKKQFELIYIDGSHERDDVMIDSLLAWKVLTENGIIIWDDYELCSAMRGQFSPEQDPKPAIDGFLTWYKRDMEIRHAGYQLIARKLKPLYATAAP